MPQFYNPLQAIRLDLGIGKLILCGDGAWVEIRPAWSVEIRVIWEYEPNRGYGEKLCSGLGLKQHKRSWVGLQE